MQSKREPTGNSCEILKKKGKATKIQWLQDLSGDADQKYGS